MKKLLLLITGLLLLFSVEGQILRYSNYVAPEEPSSDPPAFLLSDGYTEMWYTAYSGNITIDVGVQTWADTSGNSRNLIMNTDENQPSYTSGYVSFDGSGDEMITESFTGIAMPNVIYLVMNQVTSVNYDQVIRLDANDDANYLVYQYNPGYNRLSANGSGFWMGENTVPVNEWIIIRYVFNTSSSSGRVNDNSAITGTVGTDTMNSFQVGGGGGGAQMYIKEIIIRSVVDDSEDDAAIMTYLNNKYSIY